MNHGEKVTAMASNEAGLVRNSAAVEQAFAEGYYTVECIGADGQVKWSDGFHNVVTTEGKNSALTNFLKGSAFTQSVFMGLIESTGYGFAGAQGSGVAATNLASSIVAVGGGSPANGWNEATTSMCASRGTPSFGTASAGALALSSAVSFSILATATIKGCFLMVKSAAAVAAVATVGSTAGAIYSAGLFTGGDKAVANGDTLNVSYSASL